MTQAQLAESQVTPDSTGANTQPAPKTILIVEDERVVARDIQRSLIDLGFNVPATAASAEQAIALASQHCPDLILMDIRIKGERDGVDTATILRERYDIPIVYLTAYADESTVERAKLTQPYGYLMKPVKTYELRSAIEIALFKHEMDKQLRDRERWLATTMRSIGDAIIATDVAGRINYMNPVAEELTGWTADHALGHPAHEVLRLVTDDQARSPIANPLQAALDEGRPLNIEGILVRPKTEDRFISDSTAPVLADGGSLLGAVMVFRDVGEQRQLRRQLEQADRLTSLGTMAAGIAHEVNNPLSFILANIGFALEEIRQRRGGAGAAGDDPWLTEVEGALADAEEGARRVAKIVADLKTFTRPQIEATGAADLVEILNWSLQVAAHELTGRARVVRRLGDVPSVSASSSRLGQVFVNLLINAAHALDPALRAANEITVTTRTDELGRAVAEIEDNGCGMTREVMGSMFEPFFTTKPAGQGTGLGLSVSKGIVESCGGTIAFESEPGKGTLARVVLPAGPSAAAGTQMHAQAPFMDLPSHRPRGRIMLLEDDPLVRSAVRRVLGGQHALTCPRTASEARALLTGGHPFDVILCDIMPLHGGGKAFYFDVLRRSPDQARRMIFLVGGSVTSSLAEFLSSVPNRHIEKLCELEDLRRAVSDVLVKLGPASEPDLPEKGPA